MFFGGNGNKRPYGAAAMALLAALILWALPAEATGSPLREITLQLKWQHQFQFAGYYAAKERGYYEQEGLDVSFRERTLDIGVLSELMNDRAEFGIADPDALLAYFRGVPVVVLGAIFQHSPSIILSRADSGINSPRDLKGKRVGILGSRAAALWAMLSSQGVNRSDMKLHQVSWGIKPLLSRKNDAISAYLTDQPYSMQKAGIPANIMRPITYGIDFYGDCIVTTKHLAEKDPDLVERFKRASIRGWEYAMRHTDEVIGLIQRKYKSKKSYAELKFEAEAMRELILPRLVDIGTMSRTRWEHIATVYRELGMTSSEEIRSLDDFIYMPKEQRRAQLLKKWASLIIVLIFLVIVTVLLLLYFNRRLHKGIEAGTRELERNKQSLRQVIDLLPNMVYAKGRNGRILLANRAMADSLGTTVEELTGKVHTHVHPDAEQALRMQDDDDVVFETGFPKVNLEEPYTFANGAIHWLQTTRLPFVSAETEEEAILVLSVDITQRRAADEALKQSEARFRAIFNQTYQFTGILNLDGGLIQVNDAALEVYGIDRNDVLGQPFWETPWWSATEDVFWVKEAVRQAAQGETVLRETYHILPDGQRIEIDFSLKPARDEEGRIIYLIPEGRDITTLKNTEEELRRLNEELEERVAERTRNLERAKEELQESLDQLKRTQEELVLSEKLAALGGLVAGVAHEINTPLGVGVTAGSFLDEKMRRLSAKFENNDLKKSDLEKFIHTGLESTSSILTNLNRAAELIRSFKQVAADQSSEIPRTFNLHSYVGEVLTSLRPKYKRTKHVITNESPDISIFSYPGAFMQIITNLLLNSLTHAYGEDDAGRINIGGKIVDDMLIFTYCDDGKGIPEEIQDKVFEPFYTTKRGEGGTGLGLHIVFNTVTQTLGGSIKFESGQHRGTTFTITMPVSHGNGGKA